MFGMLLLNGRVSIVEKSYKWELVYPNGGIYASKTMEGKLNNVWSCILSMIGKYELVNEWRVKNKKQPLSIVEIEVPSKQTLNKLATEFNTPYMQKNPDKDPVRVVANKLKLHHIVARYGSETLKREMKGDVIAKLDGEKLVFAMNGKQVFSVDSDKSLESIISGIKRFHAYFSRTNKLDLKLRTYKQVPDLDLEGLEIIRG